MLVRLAYRLVKLVLSKKLTLQERNLFTGLILDKLDAAPLSAILHIGDNGEILVNGSPIELEMAQILHTAANAALDNRAEKLIKEQVLWVALVNGVHNGDSPEKLYFYRSAIWWEQQRERILHFLASREQGTSPTTGSYS